jgi:hypothetical protein
MDPIRPQRSAHVSQNTGQRFCRPELVSAPFSLVKTFSGAESRAQAGSASWHLGYRPGASHRPYMRVASPSVVHPLCETGGPSTVYDSMEPRLQEVGAVHVADPPAIHKDLRQPTLSHTRLSFSEQLSLFGAANEARAPKTSVRSWAALALALVIVPWVLVGWLIWTLT